MLRSAGGVRFGLSPLARERVKQTSFYIARGLPNAVSRAMKEHEAVAGRVSHEVACLVEELGVTFERTLDVSISS